MFLAKSSFPFLRWDVVPRLNHTTDELAALYIYVYHPIKCVFSAKSALLFVWQIEVRIYFFTFRIFTLRIHYIFHRICLVCKTEFARITR